MSGIILNLNKSKVLNGKVGSVLPEIDYVYKITTSIFICVFYPVHRSGLSSKFRSLFSAVTLSFLLKPFVVAWYLYVRMFKN